jgi:hypothetical protein
MRTRPYSIGGWLSHLLRPAFVVIRFAWLAVLHPAFQTKADEGSTSREPRDMKHRLLSLEVDYSHERSAREREAGKGRSY